MEKLYQYNFQINIIMQDFCKMLISNAVKRLQNVFIFSHLP